MVESSLSARLSQHGVMVLWQHKGLLLTGPPGIGKSSVGLELLQHGAVLIADDIVDIYQENQQLFAQCPLETQGLLHTRELGFIDVRKAFGVSHWQPVSQLDAIINLQPTHSITVQPAGQQTTVTLLDTPVPKLDLCTHCPASLIVRIKIWLHSLTAPPPASPS